MKKDLDSYFNKAKNSLGFQYSVEDLKRDIEGKRLKNVDSKKWISLNTKLLIGLIILVFALLLLTIKNNQKIDVNKSKEHLEIQNNEEVEFSEKKDTEKIESFGGDSIKESFKSQKKDYKAIEEEIEENNTPTKLELKKSENESGFNLDKNVNSNLVKEEIYKVEEMKGIEDITPYKFVISPPGKEEDINKLSVNLRELGIHLEVKTLKYRKGKISKIKFDLISKEKKLVLQTNHFNKIIIEFDKKDSDIKNLRFKTL